MQSGSHKKVLLALLPFWTPFIPPIGIACLKTQMKNLQCEVKLADLTVESIFEKIYYRYFDVLADNIPENRRGNFYSIGHDVLRNHMIAHLNYEKEREFIDLIRTLILKTFYIDIPDNQILRLIQVIDEFFTRLEQLFFEIIEKEQPDVLGLSVYSDTLPASMFIFEKTRKRYPHIKTVMGGGVFADLLAPGSENLEIFLEKTQKYIDHLIVGEGEILFQKLLRAELPQSNRVYTLKDIDGETLDLNAADLVDYSGLDVGKYLYMASYTSRSCPFQCSFCSETIQWGKYRRKEAKQIVRELRMLHRQYGFQLFLLSDSLLNPVIEELADALSLNGDPLYWQGWLRVDNHVSNLAFTNSLRASGFYHARMGIESGSQEVLDLMGKRITTGQIMSSLSSLALSGIKTTTLWVIGHPGETDEDFLETLDIIEKFSEDIYEAECRPFYYYEQGQVGSPQWGERVKKQPLYPGKFQDMLLFRNWVLDCEPSRQVTYERVNQFVNRCKELGIPNPYSLKDIYQADVRWTKLHKNAVPPLLEFTTGDNVLEELKDFKNVNTPAAKENLAGSINFQF